MDNFARHCIHSNKHFEQQVDGGFTGIVLWPKGPSVALHPENFSLRQKTSCTNEAGGGRLPEQQATW